MSLYLCIPLKRTWEVDLVKPLKTFISSTFPSSGGDSSDHTAALNEFSKLRNNMMTKQVDKHESALEVLYRYYDQLVAIEGKFPIAENQIRINFKWQDAFHKESLFSGKRVLSVASSSYERVCVLFNIGALQSQIAETQNLTSDDGLKLAAKLFQQASGGYAYLKDIVLSSVPADPTPDLHPDTLNALSALMLAQGQDCFVRKAMNDNMKSAVVAKLAFQCSDLYADAMKLLQLETIRGLWPKDWLNGISGKQAAFHSIAEYYQSQVAKETKDFGEEIARLRHAKELMSAAESRGGATFKFSDLQKRIVRDLQSCEKDNDLIYHSRIPEISSLAAIGKAAVAKPTSLNTPLSGAQFKDLFEKVVPLAVHQAVAGFENRRTEIINYEIGRLREATQLLNSVLASLNLPAAIEDLTGGGQVPQSLLEKAATIRQMGGIDQLNRSFNDLPELLQRNKEILDESEKLLVEEETSDQQLKAQFKERWTRTPSATLTDPIKAELSKYRTILTNAVSADQIVRGRYNTHRAYIELLSKSDGDIQASLPSACPVAALQGSPVVAELRQLMEQVEAIKAERDVTENQLKDSPSDMSSKFMSALTQDGAINEEQLSVEQLDRVYGPLRQQVTDSVRRQETLLEQIQRANTEFTGGRAQNQSGASREEKLKELAAAYDSYVELKGNLEEGTKFYNDLTQLLVKFQSKVSDFCFARKTEKDELMKDLSAGIARQAGAPTPAAPAYQQPTVEGSGEQRNPPPRPPPPKIPATATTPAQPQQSTASYSVPPGAQGAAQASASYTAQGQSSAPPYPTSYGAMPYPTYSLPQPVGYNPYMNYGGYQQPPQYPQGGYPPQQPGYPQQQGGYPPQQGGYPPQGAGYTPQQSGYPGYPPSYPAQPGYAAPSYPGGYQQPR